MKCFLLGNVIYGDVAMIGKRRLLKLVFKAGGLAVEKGGSLLLLQIAFANNNHESVHYSAGCIY